MTWLEILMGTGNTPDNRREIVENYLRSCEKNPDEMWSDEALEFLSYISEVDDRLWLTHIGPVMQMWPRKDRERFERLIDQYAFKKSEEEKDDREFLEETPLAELLTPDFSPERMTMLLKHKAPKAHEWVTEPVAQKLAEFAEPGYRQYRIVIDEFFNQSRYSRAAMDEIRKTTVSALRAKEGTIASRSVSIAHYKNNPPPKKHYQHEKILALSGVTVLAGRPKMGKSYLALNLALAIASGGVFISYFKMSSPGDVLYLALEDDASRFWSRVQALVGSIDHIPSRLQVDYIAPTLDDGQLVNELEGWLNKEEITEPRLIIIDVLRYIQTIERGKSGTLYDTEYVDMAILNRFAKDHNIQVLLVTHLNKNYTNAEDVIDTVMNSTAITGGASGIWALVNHGNDAADASIRITGKDIPTWDCALQRIDLDGNIDWKALGDMDIVVKNEFETAVLLTLYAWSGQSPTQTELRETIRPDMAKSNFYRDLKRMQQDGLLLMNRKSVLLTTLGSKHAEVLAGRDHEQQGPEYTSDPESRTYDSTDTPWHDNIDTSF